MTQKSTKVEALQRQLDIETALERVRARSMAMESSEELSDVLSVLFQQFDLLGIAPKTAWLTLWNPEENTFTYRSTGTSGLRIQGQQVLDIDGMDIWRDLFEKWKTDTSESVEVLFYSKEDLGQLFSLLDETYSAMPEGERLTPGQFPNGGYSVQGHCKFGYIGYTHTEEPSEEDKAILTRFATEFGRTYQRFLDIQKAEAQAREAQIEASLERVRARAMAMHHSEELGDVAAVLFQQLNELVGELWTCGFVLCEENRQEDEWWLSMDGGFTRGFFLPNVGDYTHATLYEGWVKGDDFRTVQLEGDSLQEHYDWLMELQTAREIFEDMEASGIEKPEWQKLHAAYFSKGYLCIITEVPCEEEAVFKRFAQAFDLAYTRFLDLQKAEAQAREAQIETALERVRAASMAMHSSAELYNVINILSEQLAQLGIQMDAAMINEKSKGSKDWHMWLAIPSVSKEVYTRKEKIHVPYLRSAAFDRIYRAEKEGKSMFSDQLTRAQKDLVFRHYFKNSNHRDVPKARQDYILSCPGLSRTTVLSQNSFIQFYRYSLTQFTEGENQVLERFGKVFEQSYTRFLDLTKAEAQAREAQIEASLERIRARTMAMQESTELTEVLSVIFQQLNWLGVDTVWTHLTLVHLEENAFTYRMTGRNGERIMAEEKISLDASEHWKHISDAVKSPDKDPDPITRFEVPPEGLDAIWELFDGIFSKLPEGQKVAPADFPDGLYTTQAYCKFGFLGLNQTREATQEEADILLRFTTEFSRLYQRFLDLQNAEKRAREAQIETALERVRARSMAMHNTEELADVLCVLLEQFDLLGIHPVLTHLTLFDAENETFSLRITTSPENRILSEQHIDVNAMEAWKASFKHWKNTESQAVDCIDYSPEMLPGLFGLMDELIQSLPKKYRIYPKDFPEGLYTTQGRFDAGFIGFNHTRRATEEEKEIVKRLAAEFGRVYQRFLDLEKAEAQAREAEIEAALERVRSRTMAMHKSEELGEVAAVLFQQIDSLGATLERLNIGIVREKERIIEWWSTEQGGRQINRLFKGSIDEPTTISKVYAAWKKGVKRLVLDQSGPKLQQWIHYVTEVIGLPFDPNLIQERRVHSAAFFKHGALLVSTPEPLPAESINLLERFAAVFEQTYTRFLDLQKAEQQAREAEIEAALERVRAKTMAMHNTDDIADTVVTFFEELIGLGLDDTMRAGIGILSQSENMKVWTASVPGTSKTILHSGFLDMSSHALLQGVKHTWSKGDPHFTYVLKGEDLSAYFQNLNDAPEYDAEFDLRKLPGTIHHRSIPFRDGVLFAFTEVPLPEDIISTLERFAAVFGQTYTRYLDLQKAEERARESRVEAALERVRAQALAMHSSQDLRQTITAIFEELKNLDIKTIRLGLGLLNPDEPEGEIITSRIGDQGEIIEVNGTFRLEGHPVLEGVYAHFKKQEDYFPILQGEEIITYYGSLQKSVDVQGLGTSSSHYGCFLYFPEGALYAWSAKPHSDEQVGILKKFSRVVEITYRRYNDLIESEAREKEAVKQASLDRVRAEISSMRTAADLGRITPLIWNELITLGVPFFRCGVFIVDEKEKKIHSYLSNPKGESLAAWQVSFGQIPVFDDMVKSWQKQEVFLIEWDRQGFLDFSQLLIEHGLVDDRERYQSGKDAPEHLVLHMLPFAQGMLYVGSQVHLETDHMELVQSLADAFSVAYARYEDFNQLEKTLADLKATQAQLIQAEKMASLGELTAGIAHEIKNPLNFVNNFSEVTRELVEEMIEELKNGDMEEADTIARDVIQNLEKIVHHGHRADNIVKGMLQHSRSGDGKKEPTDLNELTDEYLRLAYHGLRAKDKSFNAGMETDFDNSVGEIDLIPQDIGRVLLNLLTNAFYAVNERKASAPEDYKPTVWVQTERTAQGVAITVKDNGGGIPDTIVDKIFQPFFTTKPTGEGTGLGLSLSYDIIKAHGGEITIESETGKGTEFKVKLPVT